MKRLSKKKLIALGFTNEWSRWWNGSIFVILDGKKMDIYICSGMTIDIDYARLALGVKNENDLINLCRLVNG